MSQIPVVERERRQSPRISAQTLSPRPETVDWLRVAACGSLIAGGILLVSGQRRSGLVAAATGAALVLLDEKETLREWWALIPQYVEEAHWIISQVQEVIEDVTAKGEHMQQVLSL